MVVGAQLAYGVRAAWRDKAFRGAVLSLLLMLATAVAFYCMHEGWSFVDSLYFAISTGLTIGFGDLVPTTTASKVFTILYSVMTVGLFVTVGSLLAKALSHRGEVRAARREDRQRRHRNRHGGNGQP